MVLEMFGFAMLQIGCLKNVVTMRIAIFIYIFAECISPSIGFAQSRFLSSEPIGAEVYESCLLCHSTREMQRGPILDGLPSWYVLHQLNKFSKGIRGVQEDNKSELLMQPVIQQYSNPVVWKKVAERIESQSKPKHVKTIRGNPDRGKVMFAVCSSCHGTKGQGNQDFKAPPLVVQEDWYLMDQLRKFQLGMRGYDARDIEGKLMQNIARMYSVNDLKDIVAFIARMGDSNPSVTNKLNNPKTVLHSERP